MCIYRSQHCRVTDANVVYITCTYNNILYYAYVHMHNMHVTLYYTCMIFTVNSVSRDIVTGLSLSSSIEWDDCEDILVTGTGVVRSEGVVCLSDIDTVSTGDGCWLICHIVDEYRVPDIRINTSHIQREWSSP